MASNPSNALIIWNPISSGALVATAESSRPGGGRWALILDALQNPSPGRTMDEVYSTLGKKIKVHFGDGEERVRQLELLRNSVPPKLEKRWLKLMKYTLPIESANTQCQAFKDIVDLVALFPGLRIVFLRAQFLDGATSTEAISVLWNRDEVGLDCSASTFSGSVHAHVANKLGRGMVRLLKDIGVDVLTLGVTEESDYEGLDFLAITILTGVSSWLRKLEQENWTLQPWYESFTGFLQLLRRPRAAELLPNASASATETFEHVLPIRYQDAKLNITVDGDETEENQHRIPETSLVDLQHSNNSKTGVHSKISDLDDGQSMGSLREDDLSDIDSVQPSHSEADSTSHSDEESYEVQSGDVGCDITDSQKFESGLDSRIQIYTEIQNSGMHKSNGVQSVPSGTPYPSLESRRKNAEEQKIILLQKQRDLGDNHQETWEAMEALAWTQYDLGEFWEARDLRVVVLEKIILLGEDHQDTLDVIGALGAAYYQLGQCKKAEQLQIALLEKRRQLLGEDHPNTLQAMGNLAVTYQEQGQFKEAETLQIQVLAKQRVVLGEDHPGILRTAGNLAWTYDNVGRLKEAESLKVQVLENLTTTYLQLGQPKAAEELAVVALEKQIKVLGEDHSETLYTMVNLAVAYNNQGQFERAEGLYLAALPKWKKIWGDDDPDTIRAMQGLAETYRNLGKLQAAEELERVPEVSRTTVIWDPSYFLSPNITLLAVKSLGLTLLQLGYVHIQVVPGWSWSPTGAMLFPGFNGDGAFGLFLEEAANGIFEIDV
ncbi:hypothetical protein C8J57DRAFT_1533103 [Mycena rebaudengoi]|nr:hypothetical protein C8J57DRAFT_1533103 [Mycena rebaudengoi]